MPDYKIRLVVTGEDRGASRVMGNVAGSLGRIGEFAAGGLLASGIEQVVGATVRSGRAAAGALGQMVVGAGTFEQRVDTINGLLGGTAADAEKIGGLIYDLGLDPNLQVNASEAADTIETLARNGVGLQDAIDGAARSTVLLANATGAEFGDAADIATDAMSIFGIGAEDMGQAIDGIAGVVTNSKFSINDYQLALAQGGAAAGVAGVSFEEFNATVAALAPNFASGSDAGTSFKTMVQRLVPQTDSAAAAMEALGLNFINADGSIKDMAQVAGELHRVFTGMAEAERVAALNTIFGTDAMRAAAAMAGYTEEEFRALQKTVGSADAELAAAQRMDNLAGDMEVFGGMVETVRLQIGEKFQPAARAFAQSAGLIGEAIGPKLVAAAGAAATWIDPWAQSIQTGITKAITAFDEMYDEAGGGGAGLAAGLGAALGHEVAIDVSAAVTTVEWGDFGYSYDAESEVMAVDWGKFSYSYDAEGQVTTVGWGSFTHTYDAQSHVRSVQWGEFTRTYDAEASVTRVTWGPYTKVYDAESKVNRVEWGPWEASYDGEANIQTVNWGPFGWVYNADAQIHVVKWGDWSHTFLAGAKIADVTWGDFSHTFDAAADVASVAWGRFTNTYDSESKVTGVNWGNWTHTYSATARIKQVIDWVNPFNNGGGGGGDDSGGGSEPPGRAIGERNWSGGLVKVHRDEVLALPSGAHIFTPTEGRSMAAGGAGGPVVNMLGDVHIHSEQDEMGFAYRIADILQRRSR